MMMIIRCYLSNQLSLELLSKTNNQNNLQWIWIYLSSNKSNSKIFSVSPPLGNHHIEVLNKEIIIKTPIRVIQITLFMKIKDIAEATMLKILRSEIMQLTLLVLMTLNLQAEALNIQIESSRIRVIFKILISTSLNH